MSEFHRSFRKTIPGLVPNSCDIAVIDANHAIGIASDIEGSWHPFIMPTGKEWPELPRRPRRQRALARRLAYQFYKEVLHAHEPDFQFPSLSELEWKPKQPLPDWAEFPAASS